MARESVAAKAYRYLSEGRLVVVTVDGDQVRAYCRGAGDVYRLGHSPARGWYCDCPARSNCCHLAALMLVTVRRPIPSKEPTP